VVLSFSADVAISNRQREETRTVAQAVFERKEPGEDGSHDPEYVAMLDRQRREMQAHKDAMPVSEEKARALGRTIAGIGFFKLQSEKQKNRWCLFLTVMTNYSKKRARSTATSSFSGCWRGKTRLSSR